MWKKIMMRKFFPFKCHFLQFFPGSISIRRHRKNWSQLIFHFFANVFQLISSRTKTFYSLFAFVSVLIGRNIVRKKRVSYQEFSWKLSLGHPLSLATEVPKVLGNKHSGKKYPRFLLLTTNNFILLFHDEGKLVLN